MESRRAIAARSASFQDRSLVLPAAKLDRTNLQVGGIAEVFRTSYWGGTCGYACGKPSVVLWLSAVSAVRGILRGAGPRQSARRASWRQALRTLRATASVRSSPLVVVNPALAIITSVPADATRPGIHARALPAQMAGQTVRTTHREPHLPRCWQARPVSWQPPAASTKSSGHPVSPGRAGRGGQATGTSGQPTPDQLWVNPPNDGRPAALRKPQAQRPQVRADGQVPLCAVRPMAGCSTPTPNSRADDADLTARDVPSRLQPPGAGQAGAPRQPHQLGQP